MSDWQLSSNTVDFRNEERRAANGQGSLFDDAIATRRLCPSCRTTRKNLCRHDAAVANGDIDATSKRPHKCINSHDPATAPFPEGY